MVAVERLPYTRHSTADVYASLRFTDLLWANITPHVSMWRFGRPVSSPTHPILRYWQGCYQHLMIDSLFFPAGVGG